MSLQPHQQRVVDEKAELDYRLANLRAFLTGKARELVDASEFQRLKLQADIMGVYSEVLGQRIAAFTEAANVQTSKPEPTKCAHKLKPYSDFLDGRQCALCGEVVGGCR